MSGKMRILVVDDDQEVLEFLKTFFESLGHEVVLCETSEEGLKQVVLTTPDLILLDIMLPRKDGITLLKEIKELDKEATIAMITAFKDAERVIDAFRHGALDCLLKPFNLDYIVNNVLPKVKIRRR